MKYRTTLILSIALGAVLFIAALAGMRYFNPAPEGYKSSFEVAKEEAAPTPTPMPKATPEPTEEPFTGFYNPEGMTIKERIHTPEGFHREDVEEGSFAAFIEEYPLYKEGKKVKLYDKSWKQNQDAHVAVLKMKLVEGDLQQCADSIIRLYAEYFYQNKMYDKMNFHLVNGFACEFSKWAEGMRISVSGNDTTWVQSAAASDDESVFEKYLRFVFAYASTISLSDESKKVKKEEIQIGDIFVQDGSPGHAVMVMDVCSDDAGRKAFLLGQGFMPAQQFHILKNPLHEEDPWYYVDEISYPLQTAEFTFEKGSLKRPEYIQEEIQ